MNDWAFVAQTGQCLGNRIGAPATLRRTVKGAYDPVLGTQAANTVSDYSVTIKDIKLQKTDFNPSLIESGDRVLGVPAQGLMITPDIETDTIIIDSEVWFVKGIKTKRIGPTIISYVFHVKQ